MTCDVVDDFSLRSCDAGNNMFRYSVQFANIEAGHSVFSGEKRLSMAHP